MQLNPQPHKGWEKEEGQQGHEKGKCQWPPAGGGGSSLQPTPPRLELTLRGAQWRCWCWPWAEQNLGAASCSQCDALGGSCLKPTAPFPSLWGREGKAETLKKLLAFQPTPFSQCSGRCPSPPQRNKTFPICPAGYSCPALLPQTYHVERRDVSSPLPLTSLFSLFYLLCLCPLQAEPPAPAEPPASPCGGAAHLCSAAASLWLGIAFSAPRDVPGAPEGACRETSRQQTGNTRCNSLPRLGRCASSQQCGFFFQRKTKELGTRTAFLPRYQTGQAGLPFLCTESITES